MLELDQATFDGAIGGDPLLVDFWAPWCKPCRAIETVLESLAQDAAGRAEFAKLNIDEHPEIASRYEVFSIPTVMLFAGGEPQGTLVGARPRAHVERWLAKMLPAAELDGLAVQGQRDA